VHDGAEFKIAIVWQELSDGTREALFDVKRNDESWAVFRISFSARGDLPPDIAMILSDGPPRRFGVGMCGTERYLT
jgi:hypothetical protein